jgi:hypothetical protein
VFWGWQETSDSYNSRIKERKKVSNSKSCFAFGLKFFDLLQFVFALELFEGFYDHSLAGK